MKLFIISMMFLTSTYAATFENCPMLSLGNTQVRKLAAYIPGLPIPIGVRAFSFETTELEDSRFTRVFVDGELAEEFRFSDLGGVDEEGNTILKCEVMEGSKIVKNSEGARANVWADDFQGAPSLYMYENDKLIEFYRAL